jgi:hypothetical protein
MMMMPNGSRSAITDRPSKRAKTFVHPTVNQKEMGDSAKDCSVPEGRDQMSQEQVHAWHMSHNGGPQLHSETQSTTQARPREKGFVCGTKSPFPDLGTADGSCEPTTQPPTVSGALDPSNSDDGCGMSGEGKHPPRVKLHQKVGHVTRLPVDRSRGKRARMWQEVTLPIPFRLSRPNGP